MKKHLRAAARRIALDFLSLYSTPSAGVHLLNSHFITLNNNLDANHFDDQLKGLLRKSSIIPFSEAVEIIRKRQEVKHSLIAFSYDDGYAECYSHIAPVLENHNAYGCFFINPNFVDGKKEYQSKFLKEVVLAPPYKAAMNWNQITELHKKGHIIGAHTMDHARATEITDFDYQFGECKAIIEQNLHASCDYFAFTYGRNERDFNLSSVFEAEKHFKYIFGASNYQKYHSYDGRIFNRRHCEPFWKLAHINYFLSKEITY